MASLSYTVHIHILYQASNTVAGSVREVQSSPVTVEVRGAPSLPAPLPVVGREGEDVVLSLAYCCHPPATVDWVLAGGRGGRGGRVTLAEGGSWGRFTARREGKAPCYRAVLTVLGVRGEDAGEQVMHEPVSRN